jgi:hypothetical protein
MQTRECLCGDGVPEGDRTGHCKGGKAARHVDEQDSRRSITTGNRMVYTDNRGKEGKQDEDVGD